MAFGTVDESSFFHTCWLIGDMLYYQVTSKPIIRHAELKKVELTALYAISVSQSKTKSTFSVQTATACTEQDPVSLEVTPNNLKLSLETLYSSTSILPLSYPSIHLSSSTFAFSRANVSCCGWAYCMFEVCASLALCQLCLFHSHSLKGGRCRKTEPGARKANGCIPPSDIYLHCLSPSSSLVLFITTPLTPLSLLLLSTTIFCNFTSLCFLSHTSLNTSHFPLLRSVPLPSIILCHQLLSHYLLCKHVQWLF